MVDQTAMMASLGFDIFWDFIIFCMWCWRCNTAATYGGSPDLNGLIVIYTIIMMATGARVAFGYLVTKAYDPVRIVGYVGPSFATAIMYIIMMAALKGAEEAIAIGALGLMFSLVYLGLGFLIYKENNGGVYVQHE